jgi:hypothetical protein
VSDVWLGSTRASPSTNSANETLLSSLVAARSPKRTHGRCSGQSFAAWRARSASFSWRCVLSTIPLLQGWKAVVVMCLMPSRVHRASHTTDVNWVLQLEVTAAGTPKLHIHPSTSASAAVVASIFLTGTGSNHLVEWSMMVNIYLNPSGDVGSGPTRST